MADIDALNRLDPDTLAARLAGPIAEVASFLREAAEAGAVEAQLRYGQLLLDGRGVAAAPVEALRWFGRAAQAGDARGMNMVGRCFEQGWGVPRDAAHAATWFEAAAGRGLDWGLYNLATLLALGDGVAQDRGRALGLFRRAAAMGHAKSMTMVGSFFEDGWVVERDLAVATDYYRAGADGGDFRGHFNHARMLIAAGAIPAAARRLRQMREICTPAYLARTDAWLAGHADPRVRALQSGPLQAVGSPA